MNKVEAVLFDLDGTLLDTKDYVNEAYKFVLEKYSIPLVTPEKISSVMGKTLEDCYAEFTGASEVSIFCDEHRDFQLKNIHLLSAFKNTEKVLSELKTAGLKMAVVTSRSRSTTHPSLKAAKISDNFDIVIAKGDVENHKPHPEGIFKALKHFDISPDKAVMIGDTDADILAGKNAGTFTIGVTYGYHGKGIHSYGADFVIDDISEISGILLGK